MSYNTANTLLCNTANTVLYTTANTVLYNIANTVPKHYHQKYVRLPALTLSHRRERMDMQQYAIPAWVNAYMNSRIWIAFILQCIWCTVQCAAPCRTVQHPAALCSTLQHRAAPCSTLQHHAAPCSTLQHSAAPCSTAQHPAAPCSTL